jgi:hypothetical protein
MNTMSLLSKIGVFLSEAFTGPERKINDLSHAVLRACGPGVSDEEALEILKREAERKFTPQVQVQIFKKKLREADRAVDSREEVCLHVVAIANAILNMMGEDTMALRDDAGPSVGSSKRMREMCEAQRAGIVLESIDREALQGTLRRSFDIKSAWKISGHPGLEICRITDPEVQAKDEWNRTHPQPGA